MATSLKLQASKIKINRQSGSNNFYVSWALTSAQKKRKITKKVYSTSKKKKVSTSKKYPDVISSYTVNFYYNVTENGKWYLDKTITGISKSRSDTSNDLWSPPAEARQLYVTVKPVSKTYRTNKSGSTANWFTVSSTSKKDSDYDEYPQVPSIGEFSIKDKTLKAQVVIDLTNFDRLETSAVRLQVLRNGSSLVKFDGKEAVVSDGVYYIEKNYTASSPIPSSGIVNFENVKLSNVGSYQVRGAVAAYDSKYLWSEYSAWSSSIDTRPNTPVLKKVEAIAADQVKVTWDSVDNITSYEIEYAGDENSFESGTYQSITVEDVTTHVITGLEVGHKWYFRVRSVNSSDKSSPSNIESTLLATKPSAPTTWSSANVASIKSTIEDTEPVYLYWVHNSVDGSAQRYGEIKVTIADTVYYRKIENTKTDDYGELIDEISYVNMWSLELYSDASQSTSAGTLYDLFKTSSAASIEWAVATKGIHDSYSDYSVQRTIEAYENPNLELVISDVNGSAITGDTFDGFPINITGNVTPASQTPISFYISIITNDTYEANDIYGNEITIPEGSEIFSRYVDSDILDVSITPSDVDLLSGKTYEFRVICYTDAGLNASASRQLKAEWDEVIEEPDALIEFNETYRYTTIRPYCNHFIGYDSDELEDETPDDYVPVCHVGTSSPENDVSSATVGDMYFNTSTNEVYVYISSGGTTTASWLYRTTFDYSDAVKWYNGTNIDGESDNDIYPNSGIADASVNEYYINTDSGDIFRCVKSGNATTAIWEYLWNCFWEVSPNIELSIYRREANGSYVAIAENIDNSMQSSDSAVTFRDPHPAFNSCTYRIVARNTTTGAIGFADITEIFSETAVVIQWDEVWNDVEENEENEIFEGSVLELPANIKLSDSNDMDVEFAKYIGRSRPVAYYGTQRGEKPSISCEFDKRDTERLALLRQLMNYSGNVYIREPSGLGYWANVSVSYNKDYSNLTIPVTLSITPVEGGV